MLEPILIRDNLHASMCRPVKQLARIESSPSGDHCTLICRSTGPRRLSPDIGLQCVVGFFNITVDNDQLYSVTVRLIWRAPLFLSCQEARLLGASASPTYFT